MQVLCDIDFEKLLLWREIKSFEICFQLYTCIVKLTWLDGKVPFDKGWYHFVKESKLKVGDMCIFQRTFSGENVEVVVIAEEYLLHWSKNSGMLNIMLTLSYKFLYLSTTSKELIFVSFFIRNCTCSESF